MTGAADHDQRLQPPSRDLTPGKQPLNQLEIYSESLLAAIDYANLAMEHLFGADAPRDVDELLKVLLQAVVVDGQQPLQQVPSLLPALIVVLTFLHIWLRRCIHKWRESLALVTTRERRSKNRPPSTAVGKRAKVLPAVLALLWAAEDAAQPRTRADDVADEGPVLL